MRRGSGLVVAIAVVALLIVGVTGIATIQQRGGGAGDDTTGDNMPMGTTFAGIPIPGAAQPKEPGTGGESGDERKVVVEGPSRGDFESDRDWEDYEANWHDRSWHDREDDPGLKTASYEGGDEKWVAGEVVVLFPYGTSDKEIRELADKVGAGIGAIRASEKVKDYKEAVLYFEDDADPEAEASRIASEGGVVYAVPNVLGEEDGQ